MLSIILFVGKNMCIMYKTIGPQNLKNGLLLNIFTQITTNQKQHKIAYIKHIYRYIQPTAGQSISRVRTIPYISYCFNNTCQEDSTPVNNTTVKFKIMIQIIHLYNKLFLNSCQYLTKNIVKNCLDDCCHYNTIT